MMTPDPGRSSLGASAELKAQFDRLVLADYFEFREFPHPSEEER